MLTSAAESLAGAVANAILFVGADPAVRVVLRASRAVQAAEAVPGPQLAECFGRADALKLRLGTCEQLVDKDAERRRRAVLVGIGDHNGRVVGQLGSVAGHEQQATAAPSPDSPRMSAATSSSGREIETVSPVVAGKVPPLT
jgi:hypothetical protein